MKEEIKFRLGDSVYFPYHGYGTIIGLHNDGREYPIEVRWEASPHGQEVNTFTKDGFLLTSLGDCGDNDKLTVVGKVMPAEEEEMGQIVGVIHHFKGSSAPDKEEPKEEKAMTEEREFKVGDRVWSFHFGVGIVESVSGDNMQYPIAVKWTDNSKAPNTCDYFTKDGEFDCENPSMKDIAPLEIIDRAKGEEDTGVVDRMMDALNKKTDEAVNPKHYHVEGIPKAIYLMTHLMNK